MNVVRHLLIALLLASCSHGGSKPQEQGADPAQFDHLVVLGTNDFHGYLKPAGDQEEFWLATSDYLASGGDSTAIVSRLRGAASWILRKEMWWRNT